MSLSPEQQREYDEYQEMFATPGWRRVMATAEQQIYELQADALEAKSWEEVCMLRGRASTLAELFNLESTMDAQYRMLNEEDDL